MWKLKDGKLIHTTDQTREAFRTNISKALLEQLSDLAAQHRTHINYLLEDGLLNLLEQGTIVYDKKTRPKDRVQYKTTYDKELLESVKDFAKANRLNANDVIEHSVNHIDFDSVKNRNYRYRIE
ncbi:rRNA methyltransferase [Sporosarcina sp. 179-K 3D1 HS]|uniref:rRNA methyltransferase n=1 Tax=Sporosarcina sp. 179-K 3D1 HS TaxID=3232169 RepID=UPI00399F794A